MNDSFIYTLSSNHFITNATSKRILYKNHVNKQHMRNSGHFCKRSKTLLITITSRLRKENLLFEEGRLGNRQCHLHLSSIKRKRLFYFDILSYSSATRNARTRVVYVRMHCPSITLRSRVHSNYDFKHFFVPRPSRRFYFVLGYFAASLREELPHLARGQARWNTRIRTKPPHR